MPSKSNSWDLGKYRLSNWWYSQFIMDNVIMDSFIMDNVSLSFFEPDKFGLFCISFIHFLYYFYTIIVIMIFITICIIMNYQWPCCLSMTDQTTLDWFVLISSFFCYTNNIIFCNCWYYYDIINCITSFFGTLCVIVTFNNFFCCTINIISLTVGIIIISISNSITNDVYFIGRQRPGQFVTGYEQ